MVFSSVVFLFLFLPLTLLVYFLSPRRWKNTVLLLASCLFYYWGAGALILILYVSTLVDYWLGLVQAAYHDSRRVRRMCVVISLVFNLALLFYFKYTNFLIDTVNSLFFSHGGGFAPLDVVLPIGISFYTFQTLSYQFDLYNGHFRAQRSFRDLFLYVSLFPQLIAGPIVRYKDLAEQLDERRHSLDGFSYGAYRFVGGLAKKVILADSFAPIVDSIFEHDPSVLSSGVAWLGVTAFLFQIYFDFSGYSDMAIGMSRMFGFRLRENFRHPYIARSITAFWTRWHISLTTWFRDYLYKVLGGKSQGRFRQALNVYTVFFLCGLWHGADWTFAIFGLYFGTILVLEHFTWKRTGAKWPKPLQHCYTLTLLLIGLVFFRAPDISYAFSYLLRMGGMGAAEIRELSVLQFAHAELLFLLCAGALFSTPVVPYFTERLHAWLRSIELRPHWHRTAWNSLAAGSVTAALFVLFAYSAMLASSRTYNPFIYFQF